MGAPSAVSDVLAPDLRVVFCGINPGFVSAAAGAHFANPRNDFWRLLHDAGFTPRLLAPDEQFEALRFGVGLTNAAFRTTRGSGDLRRADFAAPRAGFSVSRFEKSFETIQVTLNARRNNAESVADVFHDALLIVVDFQFHARLVGTERLE